MNIRIVADSTCDLPDDLIKRHRISIVPTCINIGNKTYLDGIDMTREEFYEGLPNFPTVARTSAPGPELFIKAYEQLAKEGADEIISIHPPAKLSNLYNVAQLAGESMTQVNVTALDLGQLSLGTGLLVLKAAKAVEAGKMLGDIIQMLQERSLHTHVFAALDTFENLKRSGRISELVANIGSLLDIKPIIVLYDGKIDIVKVRTLNSAIEYLIRRVKSLGPLEQIAFMHTHAPLRAEKLCMSLNGVVPNKQDYLMVEATPVLGTHLGVGGVGLVAITK
jgi:DegV family protein with EDD domain